MSAEAPSPERIDGEFHHAVLVVDSEWIEDAHAYHETSWGEVRRKDDNVAVDWLTDDLEGAQDSIDHHDTQARHFLTTERSRIANELKTIADRHESKARAEKPLGLDGTRARRQVVADIRTVIRELTEGAEA